MAREFGWYYSVNVRNELRPQPFSFRSGARPLPPQIVDTFADLTVPFGSDEEAMLFEAFTAQERLRLEGAGCDGLWLVMSAESDSERVTFALIRLRRPNSSDPSPPPPFAIDRE